MFKRKKDKEDRIYTTSEFSAKARRKEERRLFRSILIPGRKTGIYERVVKFLIYIALRIAIRPKKWEDPEKNFKIIDYTFKKINSEDLIFIPSSIAFYFVMALVPILTIMIGFLSIPGVASFEDAILSSLNKYIPSMETVFIDIRDNLSFGKDVWVLILIISISSWVSAGGFSKLIYAQSYLHDFRHTGSYFENRVKGMFWVIILALYLNGAIILNATMHEIIMANIEEGIWLDIAERVWSYISIFVLIILAISIFFKFSPHFKVKFKNVIPGAMVVALPACIFMIAYLTITQIWNYGDYGFITVIMYIGMTMLIVSNFIFMGITTNAAYNNEFVYGAMIPKNKRYR